MIVLLWLGMYTVGSLVLAVIVGKYLKGNTDQYSDEERWWQAVSQGTPEEGQQNFHAEGQNRESGGKASEKAPYAVESGVGENAEGSGPGE